MKNPLEPAFSYVKAARAYRTVSGELGKGEEREWRSPRAGLKHLTGRVSPEEIRPLIAAVLRSGAAEKAIAALVNSGHNPGGKRFTPETVERIAKGIVGDNDFLEKVTGLAVNRKIPLVRLMHPNGRSQAHEDFKRLLYDAVNKHKLD